MGDRNGAKNSAVRGGSSPLLYLAFVIILSVRFYFHQGKDSEKLGNFGKKMCVATMLFDPFNPLEARVTCSDIVRF